MDTESNKSDTLLLNKIEDDQEPTMDDLGINPFYHRTRWTLYDKIKVGFLSVLLLPLRLVLIILLKAVAAVVCFVIMVGVSKKSMIDQPMTGWRRQFRVILAYVMRLWCNLAGFHNVKVKGRRATFKEAPILVVSPHSTPFDSIAFTYLGAPSLVAKSDFQHIPIWSTIVSVSEPVYVFRDDPNSRENTIKEIRRRATSGEEYNQILIFPEGTCTNRSCLISYKLGAFLPGVPVQPVCIKFPNRMDTVTWAWDGPGILKMVWLTLTQFHSNFEMELLPVYTPSKEEKRNPRLFADNVRDTMARSLGVPTSNLTFNDCRLITQAKENKLPFQHGFTSFQKLRSDISLERNPREELQHYLASLPKKQRRLKLNDFMSRLGLSNQTPEIKNMFRLFDRNNDEGMGSIDFREYLVGLHLMSSSRDARGRLQLIFKLYDQSQRGFLYQSEFLEGMVHGFNMAPAVALRVYQAARTLARKSTDGVTFDMIMNLAKEDTELGDYLECYHTQLIVNKKDASEERITTEVRKRATKKPEVDEDEQKINSLRRKVERFQGKLHQVHQQIECSISDETEYFINTDNEHAVVEETGRLTSRDACKQPDVSIIQYQEKVCHGDGQNAQSTKNHSKLLPKEHGFNGELKQTSSEHKEQIFNDHVFIQENEKIKEELEIKQAIINKNVVIAKHTNKQFCGSTNKQENQQVQVGHLSNGHATWERNEETFAENEYPKQNGEVVLNGIPHHVNRGITKIPTENGVCSSESEMLPGKLQNGRVGKMLTENETCSSERFSVKLQNEGVGKMVADNGMRSIERFSEKLQNGGVETIPEVKGSGCENSSQNRSTEKIKTQTEIFSGPSSAQNETISGSFSAQNGSASTKLVTQRQSIPEKISTKLFISLDAFSSETSQTKCQNETSKQNELNLSEDQILQKRNFHSQIENSEVSILEDNIKKIA